MKARNLKQALEVGYYIKSVRAYGSRLLVVVWPRYRNEYKITSFWYDRATFVRNYPQYKHLIAY